MRKVLAVCGSKSKFFPKRSIGIGFFERDYGLLGDANSGPGLNQVVIRGVSRQFSLGAQVGLKAGALGEHLLTAGLDVSTLMLGSKIAVGDVVLEVSQLGANEEALKQLRLESAGKDVADGIVYCTVRQGGYIKSGDSIMLL